MKVNWQLVGKSVASFIRRRSPEILTGLGIAGMGASVIFAVKATPKMARALKEDIERKPEGEVQKPLDKIKIAAKYYWPAATCFVTSAGCIIFASHTNYRRNAALAAACSTTENMLREYKNSVKEVVGERKETTIHDQMAKNIVEQAEPIPEKLKGSDNPRCVLFYDPYTSRYFYYDIDEMKKAIVATSFQLRDDEYVTYNEFYNRIDQESSRFGETKGWKAEDGPLIDNFSGTLTKDGNLCMLLDFNREPKTLSFFV